MAADCRNLMCSTPFGIIGILTVDGPLDDSDIAGCSTPFGIIGILTVNFGGGTTPQFRAQRLSASSDFSLPQTVDVTFHLIECSTPFGIIGILTLENNYLESAGIECSTPFGIIGILTLFHCSVT